MNNGETQAIESGMLFNACTGIVYVCVCFQTRKSNASPLIES